MKRLIIDNLVNEYLVGTRIRLIHMEGEVLEEGLLGSVKGIDGIGNILMVLGNGSSLNLLPNVDKFVKI